MENWSIDSLQIEGAMLYAGRHENHAALIYYKFLVFHPELYLSAHIMGILIITTEKSDDFRHIMFMLKVRLIIRDFNIPATVHLERTGNHFIIHP